MKKYLVISASALWGIILCVLVCIGTLVLVWFNNAELITKIVMSLISVIMMLYVICLGIKYIQWITIKEHKFIIKNALSTIAEIEYFNVEKIEIKFQHQMKEIKKFNGIKYLVLIIDENLEPKQIINKKNE